MLPTNNKYKDYQTVMEEQTPLVCDDAVENKSFITRPVTLLSIGFALFAFVALAGHVSHAGAISELKAALVTHQSALQAVSVQSTALLGASAGSVDNGSQCTADSECLSNRCKSKAYAFCADRIPNGSRCSAHKECSSGNCAHNVCYKKAETGNACGYDFACLSGKCQPGWPSGTCA